MADAAALTEPVAPDALDAEDAKIVTLARSARARTGAAHGAAVRDSDGRTYAACTVSLPSLSLTALQAAVAAAVSAGAPGLEAAAVVGVDDLDGGSFDDPGLAAVAEVTAGAAVLVAGPDAAAVHRVAS
ncbi:cytidine deaminase [Actinomycetospora lutea]|uniref:cytidine deaminase n=1 Tax=Actinomycetospora lutea TaxID=663604 RepID=UPI00236549CA|nr:cytidine deaminase [Actinomycetospora lutea]MDD7939723.1 cytidine deaminase [Actinomycetospora lutea]